MVYILKLGKIDIIELYINLSCRIFRYLKIRQLDFCEKYGPYSVLQSILGNAIIPTSKGEG